MGSPAIFSGIFTKFLKSNLNLNNTVYWLTGTADPTSVAQNGPAGSIYSNTSTGKIYKKTDAGSSTNWTELGSAGAATRSYHIVSTGGGSGSTNTKIRYWSTVVGSSGTDITYTSSSVNGDSWTINTTGIYNLSRNDGVTSGSARLGFSVNSSQLSTIIESITAANCLAVTSTPSTDIACLTTTRRFTAGDVIRCHDGTTVPNRNSANETGFSIIGPL